MKKYFCIYCCLCFSSYSFSQKSGEIERDTTFVEKLDEVVVTGQYNPQSVKKSVFEVKVLKR